MRLLGDILMRVGLRLMQWGNRLKGPIKRLPPIEMQEYRLHGGPRDGLTIKEHRGIESLMIPVAGAVKLEFGFPQNHEPPISQIEYRRPRVLEYQESS